MRSFLSSSWLSSRGRTHRFAPTPLPHRPGSWWVIHWVALLVATAALGLGPAGTDTAGRVALAVVVVGIVAAWIARRQASKMWWVAMPWDTSLWVLTLAGSAAYLTASYVMGEGWSALPRGLVFWLGLSWTAGLAAVETPQARRRAWGVFGLAGLGLAGLALAGGALPTKWPWIGPLAQHIPSLLPGLPGAEAGIHPNEAAGALLWFLPVSWAWWAAGGRRNLLECWAAAAVGLGMGGAWLLLQSRGALLGAIVATLSLLLFQGRWGRWVVGLLLVLLCGAVAVGVGSGTSLAALLTSPWLQESTGVFDPGWREMLWRAGWRASQEFPLTGLGLGQFPTLGSHFYLFPLEPANVGHAHNLFLHTWAEMGAPGVIALLAVWFGLGGWLWLALTDRGMIRGREGARPFLLAAWWSWVAFTIFGIADTVALGARGSLVWWVYLGLTVWRRRW